MTCVVCEDRGFVQAAHLSSAPRFSPFGQGRQQTVVSRNQHRRALWSRAVIVPCFVCQTAQMGAL